MVNFEGVAGNDSDGDKLDDLLEFYLGSDPEDPADGAGLVRMVSVNGDPVLRFTRRIGTDGLVMTVEESADLVTWDPVESIQLVGENVISEERNEVLFQIDDGQEAKFFRLKVEGE